MMIILTAIEIVSIIALIFGLLLGYVAVRFKVEGNPVVENIDALLPQQQCGKCGYPGCRPYAQAIANGEAEINQCPPGGEVTMLALAELLDREPVPLGAGEPLEKVKVVAFITEEQCVGCTLCIQACPVDAILGAPKTMHTVIAQECTGCELCIDSCPVNCISLQPINEEVTTWKWPYPTYTLTPLPKTESLNTVESVS